MPLANTNEETPSSKFKKQVHTILQDLSEETLSVLQNIDQNLTELKNFMFCIAISLQIIANKFK